MINLIKSPITMLGFLALVLAGCAGGGDGTSTQSQAEPFTGSIQEILALGSSYQCTANIDGVEQTSYVKNSMFYTETQFEGQAAFAIVKDDCMWSWTEQETQGMTMCFEPDEIDYEYEEDEPIGIWDQDDELLPTDEEFYCQPATISDDLFTPPSNIEFMSLSQMMPSTNGSDLPGMGMTPEAQAEIEQMMGELSDEERQAFEEALQEFGY